MWCCLVQRPSADCGACNTHGSRGAQPAGAQLLQGQCYIPAVWACPCGSWTPAGCTRRLLCVCRALQHPPACRPPGLQTSNPSELHSGMDASSRVKQEPVLTLTTSTADATQGCIPVCVQYTSRAGRQGSAVGMLPGAWVGCKSTLGMSLGSICAAGSNMFPRVGHSRIAAKDWLTGLPLLAVRRTMLVVLVQSTATEESVGISRPRESTHHPEV